MLSKSVKISSSDVNKRLFSHLIDLLFILAASFALYFSCFYGISIPTSNYKANDILITETLESHDMTIEHALDYKEYEAVCQKFYFEDFPNEIIDAYYKRNNEKFTIEHLYNIQVLGLIKDPTLDNYNKDDYFAYQIEGNKILVDKIAITKESFGPTFDRNIKKIFKVAYDSLFGYLSDFDSDYHDAKIANRETKAYARVFASSISVIIFALLIPLCTKYKITMGEKIMGVAAINYSDGYIISWWKALLRPLILYTLPILGLYFGSIYAIVLLTVAPLFFNLLTMILSKNNLDITQKILRIDVAYVQDSLIFKDEKDEVEYINSEEYQHLEDKEYLDKLANIKEVDLSTSRSDAITKNKDKK